MTSKAKTLSAVSAIVRTATVFDKISTHKTSEKILLKHTFI